MTSQIHVTSLDGQNVLTPSNMYPAIQMLRARSATVALEILHIARRTEGRLTPNQAFSRAV
jgi:hypothetical protein